MAVQPATKLKAYAALSFAVLFWGTSYVGTKVALESFPPLILAFLRFFVAGALFCGLLLFKGWPRMPLSFHKKILSVAVMGEKLTQRRLLSLVLSLGGVALLVLSGETARNDLFGASIGDLLMVGAVFSVCIPERCAPPSVESFRE